MREKPWTTEDPEDMPASAALLEVVELRGSGCVESEHLFLHVQIDGIDNPHPFAKHAKRWASRFSVRIVFCYFLWRGVQRRSRAAHVETLLTEARLSALRAQLHPHFLFNALNTVSAYVETDPQRARAMLGHLGDLLRFSLDSEDRREVSLAEEIEALDHYLAIQCARFAGRLRTHVDIPPELLDARVPGLVLQPLVENAIAHGLSGLPGAGEIRVSARGHENDLALTVADNGVGLPAGWSLDRDAGIGLSNTRSRLAETYGAAHHFSILAAAGGGVVAEIRIPRTFASSGDNGGHRGEAARAHRG